jgi:hypothetical protein
VVTKDNIQIYMPPSIDETVIASTVDAYVLDNYDVSRVGSRYRRLKYFLISERFVANEECPSAGDILYTSRDGYDYVADGSCNYTVVKKPAQQYPGGVYPIEGTSLGQKRLIVLAGEVPVDIGYCTKTANGSGGYTESCTIETKDYLISSSLYIKIKNIYFNNGIVSYYSLGNGVVYYENTYPSQGTLLWSYAGTYYFSDGNGYFTEVKN